MGDSVLEAVIEKEVNPFLEERGFSLVELRVNRTHRNIHVSIVVYRPKGVGVNDLSELSRSLRPRIGLLEELETFTLVVSSPGIERVIKDKREYEIFCGKGVRILLDKERDWIGGVIEGVDERQLHLMTSAGSRKIVMEDIRKAKLDYEEEVKRIGNVL
jgi:ribosome maturation factor RimP